MKNLFILFVIGIFITNSAISQTKTYVSSGGEMIFSFATINDHGITQSSTMRWAPVINVQTMLNADFSDHMGIFTGLALRNVGYIYDNYKDPVDNNIIYKKKFRSYNLAVPLGIKIGNLDRLFFYGGYEVELPFLYKEKTFDGGDKISTITGWFSDRQQLFQHGFLAGIQFRNGLNLKFKYYLSEFHNQNFVDSGGIKPYEGLKTNVFYFSLSSYIFKNFNFYSGPSHKNQKI
jgi:hypothetical protein